MGCFFEFDEINNVLRINWTGEVTDNELLESVSKVKNFLTARPGVRAVSDFSNATRADLSPEAVRRAAKIPDQGVQGATVVTVAPGDLIFGTARMFEMLADRNLPRHNVVRTVAEAYKLLGITSPQFKPIALP